MRYLAIIVALLLATSAGAEWGSLDSDSGLLLTPPQQYAREMIVPAAVRWSIPQYVRLAAGGTGSVIVENGTTYIVSCAHANDGFLTVGQRVGIESNTGECEYGHVVAVDAEHDCSLTRLNVNFVARPLAVASQPPPPGARVRQAGFPMMQQLRDRYTRVLESDANEIRIRAAAIPGDSGGPVINDSGELCGVLYGGDITDTRTGRKYQGALCCGPAPIRRLIAGVAGRSVITEPAKCRNGRCPIPYPQAQPVPQGRPPPAQQPPVSQGKPCDCAGKWASLDIRLTEIEKTLSHKVDGDHLSSVLNKYDQRITRIENAPPPAQQPVPTTEQVIAKLPPLHIRVQDKRGAAYSTEYQEARLGQFITLPFGKNETAQ